MKSKRTADFWSRFEFEYCDYPMARRIHSDGKGVKNTNNINKSVPNRVPSGIWPKASGKVWVCPVARPGSDPRVDFVGDCDTAIIKGVLALLIDLFSNRTLEEIRALDVDRLFKQLRLAEHLSPSRHVGIYAIVDKMIERAESLLASRLAHL